MSHKKQKSFSFFCCFCEEPRRSKRKDNNKIDINESSHNSKMYKIDTNSNISINNTKDPKNQNSFISIPKPRNDNTINYQSSGNSPIKRCQSRDSEKIQISNINKLKILEEEKKSNFTYNINYKNNDEDLKNIDNTNKTQRDILSRLTKKNKNINLENISNYKNNNDNKNLNENMEENKVNELQSIIDKNSIDNKKNNESNKNDINNINIPNNENKINSDINNSISEISESNKNIKELNIKTNNFEYENNTSKEQFINQNKSNPNKSIISNTLKKNIEKSENIIEKYNTCNEKINDLNDNNSKINTNNINNFNHNDIGNFSNNNNNNHNINSIFTSKNNGEKVNKKILALMKENRNYLNNHQQQNNNNNNNINNKENQINNSNEKNLDTNPINNINLDINNSNIGKEEVETNNNELTNKDESKINILNYINNNETMNNDIKDNNGSEINDIKSKKNGDIFSKTVNLKKKEHNFFENINDMDLEFDKISETPKLNYLTEFYSTTPQENKSIMMNEEKNINTNENNEKKNNIEKNENENEEEEEKEKEELEDEVGSIDEFHNINDNRSILSSYIFSSVHLTENKSITQSICTRSELQDLGSNYNDIMSNRNGINFIPPDMKNKEIEIRIDNGMNFMPFIKNQKNYIGNQNINNFLNSQLTNSINKMKNKISEKDNLIKKNYDGISDLKKKIKNVEEESKQYERWIENEEEENERLTHFLNFLMKNN